MQIGVVGTGLMGTSLGLHVRSFYKDISLIGYDRDKVQSRYAFEKNAFTTIAKGFEEFKKCEIVFVCCPLEYAEDIVSKLLSIVSEDTIITDISSVKSGICESFSEFSNFLGGHPMTGSERAGALAAKAELFDNSLYILCPHDNQKDSSDRVREFLEKMNLNIYIMDPYTHDRVVAMASHLPYFVASTLVNSMDGELLDHISAVAGSGFRDTSRVASSPEKMWEVIAHNNKENILDAIRRFKDSLSDTQEAVEREHTVEISEKARRLRYQIIEKRVPGGENLLAVDVPDRPGVLSNIFSMLEDINIKNIEIQDSRELSGGALRIFFRTPQDMKRAEDILNKAGL